MTPDQIPAEQVTNITWADSGKYTVATNKIHILKLPITVGSYKFGNTVITTCTKRPRWLTRFLMRWLVEWEWEDKT